MLHDAGKDLHDSHMGEACTIMKKLDDC